MFRKNKPIHKMKLRHREKYNIKKARTERMKNSPLVFMTKQLNKYNEDQKKYSKISMTFNCAKCTSKQAPSL